MAEANGDLLVGVAHEVLIFDTTTLYFASERPDGPRRKGFSKDGKPHRVQVVLAVIMGHYGLPLGYKLHPGNTADVRALKRALAALRAQYGRGLRASVVADAGMLSCANLWSVERVDLDYVVAARLHKLPAKVRDRICRLGNYTAPGPDGVRLLDIEVGATAASSCATTRCMPGANGTTGRRPWPKPSNGSPPAPPGSAPIAT